MTSSSNQSNALSKTGIEPDFTFYRPYAVDNGDLVLNFHAGQWAAWDSDARDVLVLAGTQSGKTSFGPHWLYREIERRGPGDYIGVAPTFPLLMKRALPEFLRIFFSLLALGQYFKDEKTFVFSDAGQIATWGKTYNEPTRVFFGHAQDPESLESATGKAAWLDEAGQNKFKLDSYQAITRRLSVNHGRKLLTTTPYNLGWLKQQLHDRAAIDADIDLIRFESTMNPAFPADEMERARNTLPRWKFDMFYRAIFTRPAGMIYDCIDPDVHFIDPFPIPDDWPKFMGQDYGGVNTAAVYVAQSPVNGHYFVYREYWHGGRTAAEHVAAMGVDDRVFVAGGAYSETQWRAEFTAAGLPVTRPTTPDVEVGINRVYGAFKRNVLFVFDTCPFTKSELMSYARELDAFDEPTEKIADKNSYHLCDSLRYIGTHLWRNFVVQTGESLI